MGEREEMGNGEGKERDSIKEDRTGAEREREGFVSSHKPH